MLTNDARFKGHTPLQGASSFLFRVPGRGVFLGTAKHLLDAPGGVRPRVELEDLRRVLVQWKVHPRTEPEHFAQAVAPGWTGKSEGSDWLALSLVTAENLPATPLEVRTGRVKVGETVYLIGCPYSQANCRQNVYRGKVIKREFGNSFRYTIDPPVDYRGFSGGPVIDARGYLVGVFGIWFDFDESVGGAEDAAEIVRVLSTD